MKEAIDTLGKALEAGYIINAHCRPRDRPFPHFLRN